MLKAGKATAFLWLHTLLCSTSNRGIIPTDLKRGVFVPIWEGKGDTKECTYWLSSLLARILDKVRQKLLTHQRQEQSYGFICNRSHPGTLCPHRASV